MVSLDLDDGGLYHQVQLKHGTDLLDAQEQLQVRRCDIEEKYVVLDNGVPLPLVLLKYRCEIEDHGKPCHSETYYERDESVEIGDVKELETTLFDDESDYVVDIGCQQKRVEEIHGKNASL